MATSLLTSGTNIQCGSVLSAGQFVHRRTGAGGNESDGFAHQTQTNGGWFENCGIAPSGQVANRWYLTISDFVPGASYAQWSLARSRISPFNAYTKTSAGQAVYTTDPSLDGANWALSSSQPGPALFNNNELVVRTDIAVGNQPAQIQWLGESFGAVATLTGRAASGPATGDGVLRVNGFVSSEGIQLNNSINHLEDPVYGAGGSFFALGTDYYFPGGVPTATTPGGAAPARYGLPGNVFPAYVPGQSTIFTLASDPQSLILAQRTAGTAGAGPNTHTGVLSVPIAGKLATQFVVQSLDPITGQLVNGVNPGTAADTGLFQWWIINPSW